MDGFFSVLGLAALVGVAVIGHRFQKHEQFQRILDLLVSGIALIVVLGITWAIVDSWGQVADALFQIPNAIKRAIKGGIGSFQEWWAAD